MGASRFVSGKILSAVKEKAEYDVELETEDGRILKARVPTREEGYRVGSHIKILYTKNRIAVVN